MARVKVLAIGPIGSRRGITYAFWAVDHIDIQCGCYRGTLADWTARCATKHKEAPHGLAYAAAAKFIQAHAEAYGWFDVAPSAETVATSGE